MLSERGKVRKKVRDYISFQPTNCNLQTQFQWFLIIIFPFQLCIFLSLHARKKNSCCCRCITHKGYFPLNPSSYSLIITHCVCLWDIWVSDSQRWPLEGERQDNPSRISLGIMRFGSFGSVPVLTALFHQCLARELSSLEALPWILLTLKVACTLRHPLWPKFLHLLFFVFLQLSKWFCFSPRKTEKENSTLRGF